MARTALRYLMLVSLTSALASPLLARTLSVPPGTAVFGELDERVTSRIKKDGTDVGDIVRAHVWRDVLVDGTVVIKAGEPLMVRVSEVKKAKMAGIKGKLELEASSVTAVDGTPVLLDGGYDKSGHGRMGLSISLAAVVAWPLIFIHGKPAILDPGTVFDASVQSQTAVRVEADATTPRPIRLSGGPSLSADVLYDEMDPDGKDRRLPVRIRHCGEGFVGASVVTVNDAEIQGIPFVVGSSQQEDDCTVARGEIDLKELGKHFRKGINRFELGSGGLRDEVVLDVEL